MRRASRKDYKKRDATALFALGASAALVNTASATFTYIAGYEPTSSVENHNMVDLDLYDIMKNADLPANNDQTGFPCNDEECNWVSGLLKPAGWIASDGSEKSLCNSYDSTTSTLTVNDDVLKCNTSYGIWRYGHNSHKPSSVRSLWGFANSISGTGIRTGNARPVGSHENSFIGRMNAYWKSKGLETDSGGPTWSKDIIQAAFDGTALAHSDSSKGNVFNFETAGSTFRKEVIQKGISYLNVFPYVIWEMQDAINDCHDGDLSSNDAATKTFGESVYAWDEAVAFYTGSREGVAKGGRGDLKGTMQYYLANKRCENFGTCTADTDGDDWSGSSKVNQEVFDLFDLGKEQLKEAAALTVKGSGTSCDVVVPTMEKIATKMLIPFIQGTMRYLYKTKSSASAKEAGELFAFASAALPFIDAVDPAAAQMLFHRAWGLDFTDTTYSYDEIKTAIEGTYPKLGMGAGIGTISCADIGHLGSSTATKAAGCTDPTSSSSKNNDTTLGLGIGIPLGAIAITALVFVVFLWRKSSANSKRVEELTMQLRGAGSV